MKRSCMQSMPLWVDGSLFLGEIMDEQEGGGGHTDTLVCLEQGCPKFLT